MSNAGLEISLFPKAIGKLYFFKLFSERDRSLKHLFPKTSIWSNTFGYMGTKFEHFPRSFVT